MLGKLTAILVGGLCLAVFLGTIVGAWRDRTDGTPYAPLDPSVFAEAHCTITVDGATYARILNLAGGIEFDPDFHETHPFLSNDLPRWTARLLGEGIPPTTIAFGDGNQ